MCGIAGFYGFRNDNLIKDISKQLLHRGPDGEGFYIDDKVTLLNRRLAIIDIKGGDQPIYNEDKSIVVVYNGEIYNFAELRVELEKFGHQFSTHSDTEIIVHGYEQWGEDCFDKFNGMFAIALYDKKQHKLILARDHFGIKPLYYSFLSTGPATALPPTSAHNLRAVGSPAARATRCLIFSSEIKPIINSGLIDKKPNDRIIYRYLKYRVHDDQKETFFDGVYRLMPGELLVIQNSAVPAGRQEFRVQSYSDIKKKLLTQKEQLFNENQLQKFKKLLIDSIKLRLISEVPVGTCLSGGLDSSIVVAVVNKLLKEHVKEAKSVGDIQKTFSAVFPRSNNDEEKYIDMLINQIKNIKSHKVYPKTDEFFEEMLEFVKTQEEPTISTGPYAQYKVMEKAKKHITVLLDGQGSDEMLGGYLPYYFVYLQQLKKEKKYLQLIKETFFSLDILAKYFFIKLPYFLGFKKDSEINNLLKDDFKNKYSKEKYNLEQENLKKRLIQDIFFYSLPSLLRYEDKNSMRFSIEGRVPFLDHRLLSLIFGLSDEAIIKNGWNKNILRRAVSNLLPKQILMRRNKIGFTTPEYEWFFANVDKIYEIILSQSFASRPYFCQEEVIKALHSFIEGKNDDTMLFWRFINLEIWLRIFFPEKQPVNDISKKETVSEIEINGKKYQRYLIKTDLFKKGDNLSEKIRASLFKTINTIKRKQKWFVVISEKIVAIAQGRSYFIWDIKPGLWAKILSQFVSRTPYGIGLGSPWTMQLAINEVGLVKILFASLASIITKPFGVRGVFYHIAGSAVSQIDGPTEYSLYPSNVSAKLGPKEPQMVAEEIKKRIQQSEFSDQYLLKNFLGVAIIDANDLGQRVLGNSTKLENSLIEKIFGDNPMGQGSEQTPITLVMC